jgi:putative endonuclease
MLQSSDIRPSRSLIGNEGEDIAAVWLQQHGYTILERNYRVRYGEVDLIVRKEDTIAFVEVKRRLKHYFELSDVITRAKQKKIGRAARCYMVMHENLSFSYRFDVALIEGEGDTIRVTYIEHAFCVDS